MQVARIAVLERAALAYLDGDGTEVCCEAGNDGRRPGGAPLERSEPADDAREIVLVLWDETLDCGHALGPETHEGHEGGGAVGK